MTKLSVVNDNAEMSKKDLKKAARIEERAIKQATKDAKKEEKRKEKEEVPLTKNQELVERANRFYKKFTEKAVISEEITHNTKRIVDEFVNAVNSNAKIASIRNGNKVDLVHISCVINRIDEIYSNYPVFLDVIFADKFGVITVETNTTVEIV